MTNFFNNLPKQNLHKLINLYEKYNSAITSIQGTRSSDLFLLKKADSEFEFIHKNSWKGRGIALKTWVFRLFSSKEDTLSIGSHLPELFMLLDKVNNSTKFIQQVAKERKCSDTKDILSRIKGLHKHLLDIEKHVKASRIKKGIVQPIYKREDSSCQKVQDTSAKFFDDINTFIKETTDLLQQQFPKQLTSEDCSEIASFLSSQAHIETIINSLKKNNHEPLFSALRMGLAYGSNERSVKIFNILQKIVPFESVIKDVNVDIDKRDSWINLIANIFGDPFIKGTSWEGEGSPAPFLNALSTYLEKRGIGTPAANQMQYVAQNWINAVSLTPNEFHKKIQQVLKDCPGSPKKCLIFGGWQKHSIMYEVEQQKNGLYAFRIFNRGEGSNYQDFLNVNYRSDVAGCISIKDIPSHLLFKSGFLGSLSQLKKMPGDKAAPILIGQLLPMLGGTKEIFDEKIEHFLKLQRSGTCTYAGLEAWIAHQMDDESRRIFMCEYKTSILKEGYPFFAKLSKEKIANEKDYKRTKEEYAIINRSLEDFSRFIHEQESSIPEETLERAKWVILQYQEGLHRLNASIVHYEKNCFSNHINNYKATAAKIEFELPTNLDLLKKTPLTKGDLVNPEFLSEDSTQTLKLIDAISLDNKRGSEIPKSFYSALCSIKKLGKESYNSEELYVLEKYFKRLGIPFIDTEACIFNKTDTGLTYEEHAISILHSVREKLFHTLNSNKTSALPYLLLLSAIQWQEMLFKQLPLKDRVITNSYPNILSCCSIEDLNALRTDDPFWMFYIRTIKDIHSESSPHPFKHIALYKECSFTLPSQMATDIWNWWESEHNHDLRKEVLKSIEKDRKSQKEMIREIIQINENKKKDLENLVIISNKNLKKLKDEAASINDQLENHKELLDSEEEKLAIKKMKETSSNLSNEIDKVFEQLKNYHKDIVQCDTNISEAPSTVAKNLKFWPVGFEEDSLWPKEYPLHNEKETLSIEEKATFIFADQEDFFREKLNKAYLLPNNFRKIYCHSAVTCSNMFDLGANTKTSFTPFCYPSDRESLEVLTTERYEDYPDKSLEKEDKLRKYDPYYVDFKDKSFKDNIYLKVMIDRHKETDIPYSIDKNNVKNLSSHKEFLTELHAIRSTKDMQIHSLLNYYIDHQSELKNTKDFSFFHSLLFESDLLLTELEDDKKREHLLPYIQKFFSTAIINSLHFKEYDTATNLYWIASSIQKHLDFISSKSKEKDKENLKIFNNNELFIQIIKKSFKQKNSKELGALSEAILASCESLIQGPLETEEQKELFVYSLVANMIYKKHLVSNDKAMLIRTEQAERVGRMQKEKIRVLVETNKLADLEKSLNKIAPSILRDIYTQLTQLKEFKFSDSDIFVANEGTKISLSEGYLTPKDMNVFRQYTDPVPPEWRKFLKEQKIYCTRSTLNGTNKEVDDVPKNLRCYVEKGFYHIQDITNKLYLRIDRTHQKVAIKLDEENSVWCEHIPPEEHETGLEKNHELGKTFHHRLSKDTLFLCDLVSHRPVYEVPYGKKTLINSANPSLKLAQFTDAPPFHSFEDMSHTLYWIDDSNVIQRVDFPRLNISLIRDKKKNRFIVEGQPNWFLATEQFVPQLGNSTGFLLLENEEGQKKAILPVWKCKDEKSPLGMSYSYEFKAGLTFTGHYIECEVKDNRLIPTSQEARYYMAKVFLEKGSIDEAEALLFAQEAEISHRKLSDEEITFLNDLILEQTSGDIGARNLRIRLHACFLLEKNMAQFPNKKIQVDQDIQKKLIHNYLKRLDEIVPLPAFEEQELLSRHSSPLINKRLEELNALNKVEQTTSFELGSTPDADLNFELVKNKESFQVIQQGILLSIIPEFIRRLIPNAWKAFVENNMNAKLHETLFGYQTLQRNRLVKPTRKLDHLIKGTVLSIISQIISRLTPLTLKNRIQKITNIALFEKLFISASVDRYQHYEHEIDRYQPDWVDQISYFTSRRLSHTFPFDPYRITEEEFKKSYRFMRAECRKISSWSQGLDTGMIQALYYMTFFAEDESVRIRSMEMLEIIVTNTGSPHTHLDLGTVPTKPRSLSQESRVLSGIQNLIMLKGLSEPKVNLEQLADEYFDVEICSKDKSDSEGLFKETHLEVTDETTKEQFKFRSEDLAVAKGRIQKQVVTLKKEKDLKSLTITLKSSLNEEKKLLENHEKGIVDVVASALAIDPVSYMQFSSKQRTFPTIGELCLICIQPDSNKTMQKHFPELAEKGRKRLKQAVIHYLKQKRLVQQIERSVKNAEKAAVILTQDDTTSQQIALNILRESLAPQKGYDESDKTNALYTPIFLMLETTLNLRLWPHQVDSINTYINAAQEGRPAVLQKIMGSGKTTIILSSLAFILTSLKKDKEDINCLSTVIVPDSLFTTVRDTLVHTLGTAFGQHVFCSPYERTLGKNVDYLKNFLNHLQEAKTRGACFLITPKLQNSILTSFYEAHDENLHRPSNQTRERVELLTKIVAFLDLYEVGQVDEIDTVMNPDVIFRYPLGMAGHLNMDNTSAVSDLLLELASDKDFCHTVSIDFIDTFQKRINPSYVKKGAYLTVDRYTSIVQPKLLDIAKKLLSKRDDLSKLIASDDNKKYQYFNHFLAGSTPLDTVIAELSLSPKEIIDLRLKLNKLTLKELQKIQKPDKKEELPEYLIAQQMIYKKQMAAWMKENITLSEDKELMIVYAHAISNALPKTLFKECGIDYGHDPDGKYLARLYGAANDPKTSVDGDPYKQVFLSLQKTLYYGIPLQAVEQILKELQNGAKKEMKEDHKLLTETENHQEFIRFFGKENATKFNFLKTPPSEEFILAVQSALNGDVPMLKEFMCRFTYPQIKTYKRNTSSTPLAMIGLGKLMGGYSGTMSPGILDQNISLLPEKGIDGMTITAVQEKMKAETSTMEFVSETKDKSLPEQVLEKFLKNPNLFVWIDSAGCLKTEKNIDAFVKRLLLACEASESRKNIKSIIYHEADGKIVSMERDLKSDEIVKVPIDKSKYDAQKGEAITIIQQKYDRGTNIPQKPTAEALITMPAKISLTRALQSIFRMRGIVDKEQQVHVLAINEFKEDMGEKILEALFTKIAFSNIFKTKLTDKKQVTEFIQKSIDLCEMPEELQELKKHLLNTLSTHFKTRGDRKFNHYREEIASFSQLFLKDLNPNSGLLWRYLAINEVKIQQSRNWTAARHRMEEVVKKPIRKALINSDLSYEERCALYQASEQMFVQVIQPTEDKSFKQVIENKNYLSAEKAIDREVRLNMNALETLKNNLPEKIQKIIQTNIEILYKGKVEEVLRTCVNRKDIADVIEISTNPDEEAEIEIEKETIEETIEEKKITEEIVEEKEISEEIEIMTVNPNLRQYEYKPLIRFLDNGGYDINALFDKSFNIGEKCPSLSLRFPKGLKIGPQKEIFVSPNLMRNTVGSKEYGSYHLPGRYLLGVKQPDGTLSYLLISHEDAKLIKKGLASSKLNKDCHAVLFDLDNNIVAGNKASADILASEKIHQDVILLSKLAAGKIHYTTKELNSLKMLLNDDSKQGSILRTMFENIIQYLPTSAKEYISTPLYRFLKQFAIDKKTKLIDPSTLKIPSEGTKLDLGTSEGYVRVIYDDETTIQDIYDQIRTITNLPNDKKIMIIVSGKTPALNANVANLIQNNPLASLIKLIIS